MSIPTPYVHLHNLNSKLKLAAIRWICRACGRYFDFTPAFDNHRHSPDIDTAYLRYVDARNVYIPLHGFGYWAAVPQPMEVAR